METSAAEEFLPVEVAAAAVPPERLTMPAMAVATVSAQIVVWTSVRRTTGRADEA